MHDHIYHTLAQYLSQLEQVFSIKLCIKDIIGFIPMDKRLDETLGPYVSHSNPYCMYLKSSLSTYRKCISMIPKISEKLSRCPDGFIGSCHAGVVEYVMPICIDSFLIGTVNVGTFPTEDVFIRRCIKRLCRGDNVLDADKLHSLYLQYIKSQPYDSALILASMRIIASYISMIYSAISLKNFPVEDKRTQEQYNSLIADAIFFINENLLTSFYIKDIAKECRCSESSLSHIFKLRIGVPLTTYINKLRVEHAKNELLNMSHSIMDVAMLSGFNDANYFSRIFHRMTGLSPTNYRSKIK